MTETVKHTPGPWVVGYRSIDVGCENAKAGGYAKLFDVRGWGYLTGNGHGGLGLDQETGYAIQQANAHLIAAAPDLLEALVMVRDADNDCHSDGLDTIPPMARAKIDAAIAKAEGRS